MLRHALLAGSFMLTGSAMASPPVLPDVNDSGRVLATLDDWRAILFTLMFLFVSMLVERVWSGIQMRKEREKMWEVADKFGEAADSVANGMHQVAIELAVLRALAARIEAGQDDGRI